jgi:hypothetical protein
VNALLAFRVECMHADSGAVAEGFLSRAKVSGSIAFRSLASFSISTLVSISPWDRRDHRFALAREDTAIGRVQNGSRTGSERGIDGEHSHESLLG